MADFTFNIAKGRVKELYNRVISNDPSTSALLLVPLATSGLESQTVLEDMDTFAAVVAGATNEAVGTGWNRKTLTDTELVALPAPDDLENRNSVALPTVTWTPDVAAEDISAVVVCYDANTGAGSDTDLVPMTFHDLVIFSDGNAATLNLGDFFIAETAAA